MENSITLVVRFESSGFAKICPEFYRREELVELVCAKWDFKSKDQVFLTFDLLGCGELDLHDEGEMEAMFRLAKELGQSRVNIRVRRSTTSCKQASSVTCQEVCVGESSGVHLDEIREDVLPGAVVEAKFLSDDWKYLIKDRGQRFIGGAVQFRRDLVKYSLVMGFEFDFVKNGPNKVVAVCKKRLEKDCKWRIKALLDRVDRAFFVAVFEKNHICGQSVATSSKRRFDNRMVSEIIVEDIRNMPSLSPVQVQAMVRKNYGLSISYCVAWKAMERGRSVVFGDHTKSFAMLPLYFDELKLNNPGSYTHIDVNGRNKFVRCFFAFEASLAGFKNCRPMLMVDGTFLKGRHKGCLLSAVAKDGEEGVFPVAFAVVNEESDGNWMYFFAHLTTALHEERDIVFISDRNHGILSGIRNMFPGAYHSYCYNHLKANLEYRCRGVGKKMRGLLLKLFQKCAYAVAEEEFAINAVKMVNVGGNKIEEFFAETPKEKWANAFFPGLRYGQMTSNAVESWNSQIRDERMLPIVSMVDGIRVKLMEQINRRREQAGGWNTVLCKSVEAEMNRKVEESRGWDVRKASEDLWEVFSDPVGIVDLSKGTCSCKLWQIMGLPCVHAACVLFLKLGGKYEYMNPYFFADAYRAVYEGVICPFRMPENAREELVVRAPDFHQVRGRPRKRRIPSQGEYIPRKIRCGNCGEMGNHNKKTCRNRRDGAL